MFDTLDNDEFITQVRQLVEDRVVNEEVMAYDELDELVFELESL